MNKFIWHENGPRRGLRGRFSWQRGKDLNLRPRGNALYYVVAQ